MKTFKQYKKDIVPMADPQKDNIFTKISVLTSNLADRD